MDSGEHMYWSRAAMGLVIVLVGVLFLLRNLGIALPFMQLHNWWTLFVLIGAVPSLAYAAQRYRRTGKLDPRVVHSLLSAAMIVTVSILFLLDLSLERWWPLFVIYGGLWTLVRGERRDRDAA